MSLSVVYAVDTGHVLGALTLTGANPAAEVGLLVGAALPLRVTALLSGKTMDLPVAARRLEVAAVDDEPGAFATPLSFGVELNALGLPKPALAQLAPWSEPLTLTKDKLTITLPVIVSRVTPVLALVSGEAEPHVFTGEIPAQQQTLQFQVELENGDEHGVLVLVAGQAGRLEAKVVGQ